MGHIIATAGSWLMEYSDVLGNINPNHLPGQVTTNFMRVNVKGGLIVYIKLHLLFLITD